MGIYSERISLDPREHDKVCDMLEKALGGSGNEQDIKEKFYKKRILVDGVGTIEVVCLVPNTDLYRYWEIESFFSRHMNSGIDRSGRVYTLSGKNQKFIYSRNIEGDEPKKKVDKIFEILDNI